MSKEFSMLRRLALVTAIAMGTLVASPSFAQDPAPAAASATQTPEQIIQSIADQLAAAIDGHRDELKQNHR
jgi:phospholipid transport system substrate-binding protein